MNKIASGIPKDEMDWVFVSNHWDRHLSGLCRYNGKLCWFELTVEEVRCKKCGEIKDCVDGEDCDYEDISSYSIYSLSWREKLYKLYRKKKFEICVGYHWTYPYRRNGVMFRRKKIKWLGALLWAWQYGKLRQAFRFYYRK